MPKILFCTDFDGTVSKRAGQFTVFSPLYQSLLVTPNQNYRLPALKGNIQELLKAQFINPANSTIDYTKSDADMLISPEAVAFFHAALKSDNVKVNIFTKNRADYIKALFTFHGFTPEEMSKLVVTDRGKKYDDLKAFIGSLGERAAHVYILDDSAADYQEMLRAATESGYKPAEITAHNKAVGQFDWAEYQRIVLAAPPAAKPAVPEAPPSPPAALPTDASAAAKPSTAAAPSTAGSAAAKPSTAAAPPTAGSAAAKPVATAAPPTDASAAGKPAATAAPSAAAAQFKEKLKQTKSAGDPDPEDDNHPTFKG